MQLYILRDRVSELYPNTFAPTLRLPEDLCATFLEEHFTINYLTLALDLIRQKALGGETIGVIKINLNCVHFLVRRGQLDSHINYNSRSSIISRLGLSLERLTKISISC